MSEYLWSELINHKHDIVIPFLVIIVMIYHYLDRWWLFKKFDEVNDNLFFLFEEIEDKNSKN
jgi:hypothetical protein